MNKNISSFLFLFVQMFVLQIAIAQPGDRPISILTFDSFGYVGCDNHNYEFYACSVKYPNSLLRSDSMTLIWKPDLNTLKILETFQCLDNRNDSMELPYKSSFRASSCLNTNVVMIIRNNMDTMLVSAGGSDPYTWLLTPNGYDLGLPFIFPFQKGLFYLQKLHSDISSIILFNSVYRTFLLAYNNTTLPIHDTRISHLKMNKQTFHTNDTLSIEISGRVMNDGSCKQGSILWTIQKLENSKWIIVKDHFVQMDCGAGPTITNKSVIPLFIQKHAIQKETATYPPQLEMPPGKYRLIVYDDNFQLYPTDEFTID